MGRKIECILALTIISISLICGGCGGGGGGDDGGVSAYSSDNTPQTGSGQYGLGDALLYNINDNFTFLGATSIGDLNGDGLNDVVTIETSNTPTMIFVLYQDQSGYLSQLLSFTLYLEVPNEGSDGDAVVRNIDIGDVNDDGYLDLLVLCTHSGDHSKIAVLYQDSTTHELRFDTLISVSGYSDLDIGDINSDGLNDVVIKAGNGLSVLYQDEQGSIGPEVKYENLIHPNFLSGTEVYIADMDGDNDNDIIIQTDSWTLAVVKQNSTGLLDDIPDYYSLATNNIPQWTTIPFSVGDINNDGLNDIVALDSWNSTDLNIFIQNDFGTLNYPQVLESNTQLNGIEIADINDDGLNDIIGEVVYTGSPPTGYVRVFYQNDDFSFANFESYNYVTSSGGGTLVHNALSIGDVTGDGLPDAVVTWSDDGLYVLPNITD